MNTFVTSNFAEAGIERLTDLGFDVTFDPIEDRDGRMSVETLEQRLDGVEIFISGFEGVPAELMDAVRAVALKPALILTPRPSAGSRFCMHRAEMRRLLPTTRWD